MSARPHLRTLRAGIARRSLKLGARLPPIPSERERDHAERAAMYASPRWRRERRAFLKAHPICSTPGCGRRAVIVDHRDGHQHQDWRVRFWDRSRWQPLCMPHHNAKSGHERAAWQGGGDARR